MKHFDPTLSEARRRDQEDELAPFRAAFYLPDSIYLDGNSLGLLSNRAEASLLRALEEWKTLGVDGWMNASPPWYYLAEELARRSAPLLGADPSEVIVTNSTTVNLHQLLATLYDARSSRNRILVDETIFPSDAYAIQSHLRLHGLDPSEAMIHVPAQQGHLLSEAALVVHMTPDVQMAVLPAVVYTSGQLLNFQFLTREAHARGLLIGFDCSHSIGAVPHRLSEWEVDFAFWCGYKYLNGGPGAAGGLYLNARHFGRLPGLAGWFSSQKEAQFNMAPTLEPAGSAGALQIGTPNILSMAPLTGSLELLAEAGPDRLRRKSLALTGYLMQLVECVLAPHGFRIITPREDHRRGGHVALLHPEAARICKALKSERVIPDFRPPDIVRMAPVPMYNTFQDCWESVQRLQSIMEQRSYERFPTGRELVA